MAEQQEFIAVVHTETGHMYSGPGLYGELVAAMKQDIEEDLRTTTGERIMQIYIFPWDDEHPCGNDDMDGYWSWTRGEE